MNIFNSLVRFAGFGGQENDMRPSERLALANMPAKFETVAPGDHDVQQKQRWDTLDRFFDDGKRAGEPAGSVTGEVEVEADQAGNVGIVLDHKDEGFPGQKVGWGPRSAHLRWGYLREKTPKLIPICYRV